MKALIKGWEIIRFLNYDKVITLNGETQIILEDGRLVSPKKGEEIVNIRPEGLPYPDGRKEHAFVRKDIDMYDVLKCKNPEPTFKVYRYCVDPFVYEIYGEETCAWFTSDSFHDRAMEV